MEEGNSSLCLKIENPCLYVMNEVEFDVHRVNSRKDLLHFVEQHGDKKVLERIGENPDAWVDELNILSQTLTREPLVGAIGLNKPPIGEPDFMELGNGAFLYRGKHDRLRGLWIRKRVGEGLEGIAGNKSEWTHYRMGTRAKLRVNRDFSAVPFEQFLPENFEKTAKPVEKDKGPGKRPLFTFTINTGEREAVVYAKGADVSLSYYYEHSKPGYRLTSIAGISRTTSKKEMETTLKLRAMGVRVPRVIGYYEAPMEEFLFLEGVAGKHPGEVLPSHKDQILRQDAEMLAILCRAGYRKIGFTDFDDKIFDGANLHLIDVDECRDLYFLTATDFREVLLDPNSAGEVRKFRRLQRGVFTSIMRDAIFDYHDSLTPTNQDRTAYVNAFFQKMGWRTPSEGQMKKLINFPKDYMTQDRYMSVMCDTD
jgi:hypothetical protein